MDASPPSAPARFAGRRVVVTGAASGIGRATVNRLTAEGAAVEALDVATTWPAFDAPGSVRTHTVDQRSEPSVRAVFAALGGPVDAVCVNAGSGRADRPAVSYEAGDWDALFEVNARGSFLVARESIPLLRRPGGALVFTASTSALRAHEGGAPYSATKAAVVALARSLARELGPEGIRVTSVCPGAVRTPLLSEVLGSTAEQEMDDAARSVPLRRLAEPDDVAACIAFLASDDARHVTGTELVVDGGSTS